MRSSSGGSTSRRRNRGDSSSSNHLLRQLLEMGFPSRWCAEALAATRNNVDKALTWILTNGERLSAEDNGMEEDDDDDLDDEIDKEEDESAKKLRKMEKLVIRALAIRPRSRSPKKEKVPRPAMKLQTRMLPERQEARKPRPSSNPRN